LDNLVKNVTRTEFLQHIPQSDSSLVTKNRDSSRVIDSRRVELSQIVTRITLSLMFDMGYLEGFGV